MLSCYGPFFLLMAPHFPPFNSSSPQSIFTSTRVMFPSISVRASCFLSSLHPLPAPPSLHPSLKNLPVCCLSFVCGSLPNDDDHPLTHPAQFIHPPITHVDALHLSTLRVAPRSSEEIQKTNASIFPCLCLSIYQVWTKISVHSLTSYISRLSTGVFEETSWHFSVLFVVTKAGILSKSRISFEP